MNTLLNKIKAISVGIIISLLATSTHAKPLKVGLHTTPPWAYTTPDGEIVGIEKEIIETILKKIGYEPTFKIYGYSRLLKEIESHRIDFASPVALQIPNIYYTKNYLPLHDIAMTLKKSDLQINSLKDLKDKDVIAYQHASEILGEDFNKLTQNGMESYHELYQRESQIRMLFLNRVNVLVGDKRILTYFAEQLYGKGHVITHAIFPEIHYPAATWDKNLASQFNQGVEALKKSGEFQKILDKYTQ